MTKSAISLACSCLFVLSNPFGCPQYSNSNGHKTHYEKRLISPFPAVIPIWQNKHNAAHRGQSQQKSRHLCSPPKCINDMGRVNVSWLLKSKTNDELSLLFVWLDRSIGILVFDGLMLSCIDRVKPVISRPIGCNNGVPAFPFLSTFFFFLRLCVAFLFRVAFFQMCFGFFRCLAPSYLIDGYAAYDFGT